MEVNKVREFKLYVVFFMILVFCLSGGYLYLKLQVIKEGYSFVNLQNRKMALEDINRKMMLELAHISSFEVVEQRAKKELGMVHLRSGGYIVYVSPEKEKKLTASVPQKQQKGKPRYDFFIDIFGKARASTFTK